ncbi:hypothetical protein C5167_007733 [Papaver somniferum]|nr:hypothetical protein C5167_007733 [Papaver somniferum]
MNINPFFPIYAYRSEVNYLRSQDPWLKRDKYRRSYSTSIPLVSRRSTQTVQDSLAFNQESGGKSLTSNGHDVSNSKENIVNNSKNIAVYDSKYEGLGLFVDPYLRMLELKMTSKKRKDEDDEGNKS